MQVVLVRPWTDAHAGGCCSVDPRSAGFDRPLEDPGGHDGETLLVAETYLALRSEMPDLDVQVVAVGNTAYLLPTVFRALWRRHGTLAALRGMSRATTAGSLLVDGEAVGLVASLGVRGSVDEVRRRRVA